MAGRQCKMSPEVSKLKDSTHPQGISIDHISRYLGNIGITLTLPAMIILTTVDVVLRYLFNAPIFGAHDVSCLLMMLLVFSSLPYCWVERGHVRMELLVRRFPDRGKNLSWALAAGFGAFVWGMVAYYSFVYLSRALEHHEITQEAEIVLWPFRIFFTAGASMFSLQMFVDFLKYLKRFVRNSDREKRN
jgi:TRAP-type C4-dicarboxylate transport system permease small subunit